MAVAARRIRKEDTENERRRRRDAAIALLESWVNVDEAERNRQRDVLAKLMQVMDEDRFSTRELFPKDGA